MTESDIIKVIAGYMDKGKYPYQLACSFIYKWESDYWTMTQEGETREFEIKISRSDYFADAKKDKHKTDTGANYFYYVCPKDLIKKHEVDSKYGLIYIDGGCLEIVKKPRRLNQNLFEDWKHLANKMYWKWRELWKQKFIAKEITRDQYYAGFHIDLTTEEPELLTP